MNKTTDRISHRIPPLAKAGVLIALVCTMMIPDRFASAWDGPTIWPIGEIGKRRITLGNRLWFTIGDQSGDKAGLPVTSPDLPEGAQLYDNGDGSATFDWTPEPGQEGAHTITFTRPGTGETETIMAIVGGLPLSHGFYRLGYGTGLEINTAQDHITHTPVNKLDFNSVTGGPGALIPIVAAADGRIRDIEDSNTACCSGCAECNNFIWIEHSNGEWTKYSHPITGSVTATFGWSIGDCVQSGDTLGYEGDVGATTGSGPPQRKQNFCAADGNPPDTTKFCFVHLHFEVRQTAQDSELRVPLICEASSDNYVVVQGNNYFAGSCGSGCPTDYIINGDTLSGDSILVRTADNSINIGTSVVGGTASMALFAGNKITLKPGFAARTNSYFHAMIKPCEGQPTGCPPP